MALFDWPRNAYASAHRYYLNRDMTKMMEAIRAHYGLLVDVEVKLESTKASIDWSSGERDCAWDIAWKARSDARDMFVNLVIADLFDNELIDKLRRNGNEAVSSRLDDLIELKNFSLEDRDTHLSFFVPAEIAYLADLSLKGTADWGQGKDALFWFIDEISFYSDETPLPSWLFDDEEVALTVLGISGNLIQFMGDRRSDARWAIEALRSEWSSYIFIDERLLKDREVVKAAFSCGGCGSVLFEDAFRKYSDDVELVALALRSSGENLSWASERMRDDFDMVSLAIENSDYIDNIYSDISERLRCDRRIVEKIARRPSVPMEFPPFEYKDDDEIGAFLADTKIHGDHFSQQTDQGTIYDRRRARPMGRHC